VPGAEVGVGRGGAAVLKRTWFRLKSPPFTISKRSTRFVPPAIEMPERDASVYVCQPPVALTAIVPRTAPSSRTRRSPTASPAEATRAVMVYVAAVVLTVYSSHSPFTIQPTLCPPPVSPEASMSTPSARSCPPVFPAVVSL
jgi:hypothetical protein